MNRLKKFWIVFLSFLPWSAGAVAPIVGLVAGGVGVIAGFSIYRTAYPVDMASAMQFFSSCWSCQMFSDILAVLSQIVPRAFSAVGGVVITFSAALIAVWFAWQLLSGFFNGKIESGWSLGTMTATRMLKFAVMSALVLAPLPRMMSQIALEPIFTVGLAINRAVSGPDEFAQCVVATAAADTASVAANNAGAFSPKMRHNLACEIGAVHRMTGVGMTAGWTMMNMAFNEEYMHKFIFGIPIFPNVALFFGGAMVLVLFFFALLPVPLYFLEIFIQLSMDLIMLPLTLMSWVFGGWKIFPSNSKKNIESIINDVVSGALGIAATGIFVTFGIMFINAIFGRWNGATRLAAAIAQNDSKLLIDGLMMRNDSLVTIILMGLFLAMFMTMIPTLSRTLFNIEINQTFYQDVKKHATTMWNSVKKIYANIKK